MAVAEFDVSYDGPALATAEMAVRDLAPALLALGELFHDASRVAYPDRSPVALKIRATSEGSFLVDLILEAEHGWENFRDFFSGDTASALANLIEIVAGAGGLFALIRTLGRRKVKAHKRGPEPTTVVLELEDGTAITIHAQAYELYLNVSARQHARDVVEPLRRDGVDVLEFRRDKETTLQVTQGDVDSFEVPDTAEALLEDERELIVAIAAVTFVEGNKWRLSDGNSTFFATIEDREFLDRVEQGEPFRKGDMLRVVMRITQTRDAEGLHSDYLVTRVLEHIPREVQLRLDDEAP